MMDWIYPSSGNGLIVFLIATVTLGGAAARAAGRAMALTWRPLWQLAGAVALMTLVVRFFHYALFHEPFLTIGNLTVDFVVLMGFGLLGYRMARARQMVEQYPWLYEAHGVLGWRRR
ncbi:MAG: hypothetical protein NW217_15425 [Hyphomicrobiaceae bacterium]|nr:hypothetical protein [Hyphomicrobiaceae bacterium]